MSQIVDSQTQWLYASRMQIRELNWEDNPSDDGSKGLELDALTKNDRWLTGPNFLWEKEEHWSRKIEIPCIVNDVP